MPEEKGEKNHQDNGEFKTDLLDIRSRSQSRSRHTLMGLLMSTRALLGLLTSRRARASRRGLRLLIKSSALLGFSGDPTAAEKDRIDV